MRGAEREPTTKEILRAASEFLKDEIKKWEAIRDHQPPMGNEVVNPQKEEAAKRSHHPTAS